LWSKNKIKLSKLSLRNKWKRVVTRYSFSWYAFLGAIQNIFHAEFEIVFHTTRRLQCHSKHLAILIKQKSQFYVSPSWYFHVCLICSSEKQKKKKTVWGPHTPKEPYWGPDYVSTMWLTKVKGRAIAQAVSRRLPTAMARVQTRVWSCGILGWTKVALGQVFSENFVFPGQSTFHLFLHNHLHFHPRVAQ
jgi:hypothetical protein